MAGQHQASLLDYLVPVGVAGEDADVKHAPPLLHAPKSESLDRCAQQIAPFVQSSLKIALACHRVQTLAGPHSVRQWSKAASQSICLSRVGFMSPGREAAEGRAAVAALCSSGQLSDLTGHSALYSLSYHGATNSLAFVQGSGVLNIYSMELLERDAASMQARYSAADIQPGPIAAQACEHAQAGEAGREGAAPPAVAPDQVWCPLPLVIPGACHPLVQCEPPQMPGAGVPFKQTEAAHPGPQGISHRLCHTKASTPPPRREGHCSVVACAVRGSAGHPQDA
ncbi:hypothetical protein HaLaN_03876 [Haematococcus lacustris]|uniref:Uncharacterized protein n=1 Tax=Haematococcus lacustris TaxID=44745 RepID=A0A699YI05_HAELA|nr:hypothetical protein HaLaN_03876 [Haematococcus lacustris]